MSAAVRPARANDFADRTLRHANRPATGTFDQLKGHAVNNALSPWAGTCVLDHGPILG